MSAILTESTPSFHAYLGYLWWHNITYGPFQSLQIPTQMIVVSFSFILFRGMRQNYSDYDPNLPPRLITWHLYMFAYSCKHPSTPSSSIRCSTHSTNESSCDIPLASIFHSIHNDHPTLCSYPKCFSTVCTQHLYHQLQSPQLATKGHHYFHVDW